VKSFSFFLFLVGAIVLAASSSAQDFAVSRRLGISLATLQKNLEKVAAPIAFASRAGSTQGTQEAPLPNRAGVVQASGDQENLGVIVLWLPVDLQKKRIDSGSRGYLDALVQTFMAESEPVALWLERVLQRALTEGESGSHLESQLFDTYQFKATYVSSLSRPMLSLTLTKSAEE